ncbi:serine O-acetyltransferase EpsC [Sphingomonas immobilis]|uniref:serine O-acetyltransferase n=1 Tax=Sphingomonas immobilis TaxID=3063997 RepID=A0ABT8ZY46_9SPHN|nr:serine O-acetyltransferase EpsC [Sphingomonas sp. CA1-15]MDO7842505.1 serine O-acetyltransferase EpsC [Sphingomonas sp. CA1-15]
MFVAAAISALREARTAQRASAGARDVTHFPSVPQIEVAIAHLSAALYPRRLGDFAGLDDTEDQFVGDRLVQALDLLRGEIEREFAYWQVESRSRFDPDQADTVIRLFTATLGGIRTSIDADIEAAFLGDPAARSLDEILVCYPGAIAVRYHRIAHELHQLGVPIVARIISELANSRTGIDIHPGASIGPGFFIDHGTGVVIGETSIIGARVKLYQHVTLGARSPLGLTTVGPRERYARHPIIEDDVIVYAGATILGRVTIGAGSTIGGNVWLLDDVPPGSIVAQPEASVVDGVPGEDLRATLLGRAA